MIYSRAFWNAKPPRSPFAVRSRTSLVVLHHTAGPNDYLTLKEEIAYQQQMQAFHQRKGWIDIAQHYTVMRSGRIFEGRPHWAVGSHCPGVNSISIGIEVQGTFLGGAQPSPEQIRALQDLYAMLAKQYKLPMGSLSYHRRHYPTQCPGDLVNYLTIIEAGRARRRLASMHSKDFYGKQGWYQCHVGPVKPNYQTNISVFRGAWLNAYAVAGPVEVDVWWEDTQGRQASAVHKIKLAAANKGGVDLYWLAGAKPLDGVVRWKANNDVAIQIDRNEYQE